MALMLEGAKLAARRRAWERRRTTREAQLAALREPLKGEQADFEQELAAAAAHERRRALERAELVSARRGGAGGGDSDGPRGAAR
jgi:hypothetical protein